MLPGSSLAGLVVGRTMRRLGATSRAIRRLHAVVGRTTSGLPRCPIIVTVGNMNGSLNPRLVTRVNSISQFARGKTVATFTNISPNMGRSNSCRRGDIPTSGHNSDALHGALFRIVSILVGAGPRSSPICLFVSGGQTRKGPCCICVATNTGGFLHVCCNQIGRCLSSLPRWVSHRCLCFEPTGVNNLVLVFGVLRGFLPRVVGLLLAFCLRTQWLGYQKFPLVVLGLLWWRSMYEAFMCGELDRCLRVELGYRAEG